MSESKLRNMKTEWKTEMGLDGNAIEWEVQGNPKRPHGKSHARFENYFGSATVKEYLDAGGTKGDLKYDFEHRFLNIKVVEKPEEEKPADEPKTTGKSPRSGKSTSKSAESDVNEILA